jgi:hypothetical protein
MNSITPGVMYINRSNAADTWELVQVLRADRRGEMLRKNAPVLSGVYTASYTKMERPKRGIRLILFPVSEGSKQSRDIREEFVLIFLVLLFRIAVSGNIAGESKLPQRFSTMRIPRVRLCEFLEFTWVSSQCAASEDALLKSILPLSGNGRIRRQLFAVSIVNVD